MKKVLKFLGLFFAGVVAISIVGVLAWPVLVASIVGLIYFSKVEPNKKYLSYAKRGVALGIMGVMISLVMGGGDNSEDTEPNNEKATVEEVEPEAEELELTESERIIVTKDYREMSKVERDSIDKILKESDMYVEADKELIGENEEGLKEERTSFVKAEKEKKESEALAKKEEEQQQQKKKDYEDFIVRTSGKYSELFISFSQQIDRFEYTDKWIFNTSGIILQIKDISDEVISYDKSNVPDEYTEVHNEYVEGASKFKDSMDLFVEGFDSMDGVMIEESSAIMVEGNSHIDEATRLIMEIVEKNNSI